MQVWAECILRAYVCLPVCAPLSACDFVRASKSVHEHTHKLQPERDYRENEEGLEVQKRFKWENGLAKEEI